MSEHEPNRSSQAAPIPLRREHPELYGKLLEANAAIGDAGGILFFLYLILLIGLYCGLWMGWYHRIPVLRRMDLGNFWMYALVTAIVVAIWIGHFTILQRLCYRRHRDEILDLLRATKLTRYRFLAETEGDQAIQEVASALKRDRWDSF